jgi:Uma2 family endonuclease
MGKVLRCRGLAAHAQFMLQFGREPPDVLEEGPCVVTVEVRLQVAEDTYVYPDVMVTCGAFVLADGHRDVITNPLVVVEVLSESTERWDRGEKFAQYRRVASLQEYVLVSQDAMRVEWYTRGAEGTWTYREAAGPEGVVRLESLGVRLGLGRIYRKVAGVTG